MLNAPLNPHMADSRPELLGCPLMQGALDLYTNRDGRLKDVVASDHHHSTTTRTELQRKYRVHQAWLDSYLSRKEQQCLFQLSVFRGSFNLGAATAVILSASPFDGQQASSSSSSRVAAAGRGAAKEVKVEELLELLTNVSIMQRSESTASRETRYSMHLLIRELAGDQLQSPRFAALHTEAQRTFAHLVLQLADRMPRLTTKHRPTKLSLQ
jgi:mevalonate pyrophosphate decarboxylase